MITTCCDWRGVGRPAGEHIIGSRKGFVVTGGKGAGPGGPLNVSVYPKTHLFSAGLLLLTVSQFTYVRTTGKMTGIKDACHLDPCQLLFRADNFLDIMQDL